MRPILALVFVCPLAITAQQADPFAAIALEQRPARRGGISEKRPPILSPIRVEVARSNPQLDFPRRPVMRTRAEFRTAVADLRRKFAPFLEDYTPPAAPTRASMDLDVFDFRMEDADDRLDIGRAFRGEGSWQSVRIPDYRGPVGWWAGYYRKVLRPPENVLRQPLLVLRFGAVDYRCQVYLNGRMVGAHEGLFGGFEIDITPWYRRGSENVLLVRVENDFPMTGVKSWGGPDVNGEKIYAAVGPGWNEPVIGWHHCPPGAGIWQRVYLEGRPAIHFTDLFVRPNLSERTIEVRAEVYQPEKRNRDVTLRLAVFPKNFQGPSAGEVTINAQPAGPGLSEYRATVRLGQFRCWDTDTPWLYTLRATVQPQEGDPADVKDAHFGMREFEMDSTSAVKGTLLLNKEPVILRGANTMGHLMRAVMEGNREQLIEDILIARLANMNYFRLTQSPVQPEVYDICDRLGMMLQTDLPLFGRLRRTTLEEAVKQSGEMERLIRDHPSSIMISYINEPTSAEGQNRHLTRTELERFFEAASAVVHVYNPDRVIKAVDGDYDPPGPGIPDNHVYSAWYGSHAVPIGKLIRGYWVANKDGWKHGSGEYGVEGLDCTETMFKHYPKEWLPASVDSPWNPISIPRAQTGTMHHGWFDAQTTMREWIEASQRHQAWGARTQTRAFRRQTDRFVSTAVHLLIDAWPSGWMKSLVDVDRNPKPAFFEYKEALTPLMVDIRTDRTRYYSGEPLQVEFWVANDRRASFQGGELLWEVLRGGQRVFAQSQPAQIPSFGAAFQGYFPYPAPVVSQRERLTIRLGLKDPTGRLVHDSELELEIFPVPDPAKNRNLRVEIVGRRGGRAWRLAEQLGAQPMLSQGGVPAAVPVLVDSVDAYEPVHQQVLEKARAGATVLFLEQEPGAVWRVAGDAQVSVQRMAGKEFVSRKTGHPIVASFQPHDFGFWYDPEKDYIEYAATSSLSGDSLVPILLSGQQARAGDPNPKPISLTVAAELRLGKGTLIFSQLKAAGRVMHEPVARAWFQAILDRR